jgi:hypothetical protein
MELIFKPQFLRDYDAITNVEIKRQLAATLSQIERATSPAKIGGIKKLDKYGRRHRIKIKLNEKDDYRLGLLIQGNRVWVERMLRRPKFYGHYRR